MFKKCVVVFMCAAIVVFSAVLVGCGGVGTPSVEGLWKFESIQATSESLSGLDDAAKSDREAEADMLAVFMDDEQIEFDHDGTFVATFLGDTYSGAWEINDGSIVVTMGEDDYSESAGKYKIDGDTLVFDAGENDSRLSGFKVTYVRATE